MINPVINDAIGYIVGGSLKENLLVRLSIPAQQVQEGSFIVIESGNWHFYGIATDLQLGATDPRFADEQSESRLPQELANLLVGQTLFTNLVLLPALMLETGPELGTDQYEAWQRSIDEGLRENPRILPVKTVPTHHALARLAQPGDIEEIFGSPEKAGNFIIGSTREQYHPVCINLDKLILRSSGVFGATGSGKSFLARILLAGLISHNRASVLVYDMHNEYGLDDTASDTGENVHGLQTLFGKNRVQIAGLGANATIRGHAPDFNLVLATSDITPEDIDMLTHELNLRETTPATLEALVQTFGQDNWFREFKNMKYEAYIEDENGKRIDAPGSVAAWARGAGINELAAKGLHSKLKRLFNMNYLVDEPPSNSMQDIIEALKKGKHVVLSFGDHQKDLDYLLVSNLLTRHIRAEWEKMTNQFRSGKSQSEPRPLVVVLEEAHKLLNREMAAQTTFSTIAREMRKYYVTLLVIDQRPSQIYDEVMSQLGTRVCGWLGDDDDIQAVLSGLAGRDALRGMLARLQPAEEALLLGWGVPMPILVRTRRYDETFWDQVKHNKMSGSSSQEDISKLWPG
jgi:hypothetical protein